MRYNANELNYYLIDMDNHLCLFTNMRIDRDTVPGDLYCYDVRDGDDCTGIFAEIQSHVLVNHWGTILTKDPVPLNEYHCYWPENEDPYFGPSMELEEFRAASREELDRLLKEEQTRMEALYKSILEVADEAEPSLLSARIQDAQERAEGNLQPPESKDRTDKDH